MSAENARVKYTGVENMEKIVLQKNALEKTGPSGR